MFTKFEFKDDKLKRIKYQNW